MSKRPSLDVFAEGAARKSGAKSEAPAARESAVMKATGVYLPENLLDLLSDVVDARNVARARGSQKASVSALIAELIDASRTKLEKEASMIRRLRGE